MEASQSGTDTPGQEAPISQQESTEPSGLQTPQPDQPVPTEAERQESPYPDGAAQQAAHEQKEREQDAERAKHNARTGGGETQEGARQTLRDEHLQRTSGTAETSEPEQADANDGSQDQA